MIELSIWERILWHATGLWRRYGVHVREYLADNARELVYTLGAVVFAIARAMGVMIDTGQHGLLFHFGRARRVVGPGFHWLLPGLQKVRKAPTRSRSMDLAPQEIANEEGLVYHVEANVIWRIVDLNKALIEIDDVQKGMREMLGLGVQRVISRATHDELRSSHALDDELVTDLAARLEPWGVAIEHAGLTTVTPSGESLRVTQLAATTRERLASLSTMQVEGLATARALSLFGMRKSMLPARTRFLKREQSSRRERRIRRQVRRA